jgi:hypothetical protein
VKTSPQTEFVAVPGALGQVDAGASLHGPSVMIVARPRDGSLPSMTSSSALFSPRRYCDGG